MGGGDALCAWTAGTLVCQKLHCSCDFPPALSSASFVGKFCKEDNVEAFRDV